MKWRKLGRIFRPEKNFSWMTSHAAVPVAEHLQKDIFRIYFSCRDSLQRSHMAWADLDLNRPSHLVGLSSVPLLSPGTIGSFDDSGAMLSWIVPHASGDRFYYFGWNRSVTVPFRNAIGLALRNSDAAIRRYAAGPILDRSPVDPCFVSNPCVVAENDCWHMWYLSCIQWLECDGAPRHRYHIKYAKSNDGISWHRDGAVSIDFASPGEYAISRPCVIRDRHSYYMWYSYRGESYRIGYAESTDGVRWQRRDDQVGIGVSPSGWDSEMIEYPYVFDHRGKRYMLYNGNGYGSAGFGLAVLEQD